MKPGSLRFKGRSRSQKLEAFTFSDSLYLLSVYSRAYHRRYTDTGEGSSTDVWDRKMSSDRRRDLSRVCQYFHFYSSCFHSVSNPPVSGCPRVPSVSLFVSAVLSSSCLWIYTSPVHHGGRTQTECRHQSKVSLLWLVGLCRSPEAKHPSASISSMSL